MPQPRDRCAPLFQTLATKGALVQKDGVFLMVEQGKLLLFRPYPKVTRHDLAQRHFRGCPQTQQA